MRLPASVAVVATCTRGPGAGGIVSTAVYSEKPIRTSRERKRRSGAPDRRLRFRLVEDVIGAAPARHRQQNAGHDARAPRFAASGAPGDAPGNTGCTAASLA